MVAAMMQEKVAKEKKGSPQERAVPRREDLEKAEKVVEEMMVEDKQTSREVGEEHLPGIGPMSGQKRAMTKDRRWRT